MQNGYTCNCSFKDISSVSLARYVCLKSPFAANCPNLSSSAHFLISLPGLLTSAICRTNQSKKAVTIPILPLLQHQVKLSDSCLMILKQLFCCTKIGLNLSNVVGAKQCQCIFHMGRNGLAGSLSTSPDKVLFTLEPWKTFLMKM